MCSVGITMVNFTWETRLEQSSTDGDGVLIISCIGGSKYSQQSIIVLRVYL